MKKNKIMVTDPSMRDGNHAVNHSIDEYTIKSFVKAADFSNIPILEVGHGNGLGASSLSIGRSKISNLRAIKIAKKNSKKCKISSHSIPGFSTFEDIMKAKDNGLDIIRIGANATELDTILPQIDFSKKIKLETWAVVMMSHLLQSNKDWKNKISLLEKSGIKKIIIMDSAGYYNPFDIEKIFKFLSKNFKNIVFGFHGHNNYGCAVWNTITAVKNGAKIIDSTIKGFGAGAGNTPTEIIVPILDSLGFYTDIDLVKLFDLVENFEKFFKKNSLFKLPTTEPINIMSARYGLFSGFAPKVKYLSKKLRLNPIDSFKAIGEKKLVAGQEDLILNILVNLKKSL